MQDETTTISQQHVDAFKYLFEQEETRYRDLIDKAKSYQTVVTAYTGLVIVVAGSNSNSRNYLQLIRDSGIAWLVIATVILLVTSMILVIYAQRVARQEGVVSMHVLAEELSLRADRPNSTDLQSSNTTVYDIAFAETMIAGFVVATERNEKVNDQRARCLWYAGVFMTATIALHLFQVCFIIIKG